MTFPWIQLLRLLPGPASQCRKKEIRDDGLCSHLRLPTYRPCCLLHTTAYSQGQPWAHCSKLIQIVLKECVSDFLYWIIKQWNHTVGSRRLCPFALIFLTHIIQAKGVVNSACSDIKSGIYTLTFRTFFSILNIVIPLFYDVTRDFIANNFVIDVQCICLQILYQIAINCKI